MSNLVNRVIEKIQRQGFKKSFLGVVTNIYDRYYDYKHRFDTFTWVEKEDLGVEDEINSHAALYQATRALPLRSLLKPLNASGNEVLIDIGSGKGRVLLIAAELGYKDLRGVEFSPILCNIAEQNIRRFKQKKQISATFDIVNMDASQYQFKDDETIFFFYNPFDEYIMEKVLDNIEASLQRVRRDVSIVYANPVKRSLLENRLNIKKTINQDIWGCGFVVYEL